MPRNKHWIKCLFPKLTYKNRKNKKNKPQVVKAFHFDRKYFFHWNDFSWEDWSFPRGCKSITALSPSIFFPQALFSICTLLYFTSRHLLAISERMILCTSLWAWETIPTLNNFEQNIIFMVCVEGVVVQAASCRRGRAWQSWLRSSAMWMISAAGVTCLI